MTQYQYIIESLPPLHIYGAAKFEAWLNEKGAEGWAVFYIDHSAAGALIYMRRELV